MRVARALRPGLVALALLVAGCGGDDDDDAATTTSRADQTLAERDGAERVPCRRLQDHDHRRAPEGDELRVTWEANFEPDFSKNHIHVYWDTYTADR